jgi:two-component system, cell cycle sensor histidine kinase and response regulator CckA
MNNGKNQLLPACISMDDPAFSSRFLQTLINLSPDIIYIFDLIEQKNIYSNDGIEKVLGYSVTEIQEMGNQLLPLLMHPEDLTTYFETTYPKYSILRDGEPVIHRYRMRHKDGSWHFLEANEVIYARNPDTTPRQIFGVVHDISEYQATVNTLKESEAKFRSTFNQSPVAKAMVGLDKRFIRYNRAFCRFLGYSEEELIGKTIADITFSQDKELGMKELQQILEGTLQISTVQKRYVKKNGEIVWGEVQISLVRDSDGKPLYFLPAILDLTERKHSEENLKKAADRFQAMIDNAPLGAHLYELFSDNRLVFSGANRSADMILQVKNEQFIGKTIEEAFPNLASTDIPAAYRSVALTGKPFTMEQLIYSDDQGISGAYEISAFQTASNKMAVLFRDITDKKIAEEALKASETKFRTLFNTMTQGVVYQNADGTVIDANPAALRILGVTRDEINGTTSMDPRWKAIREDGSDFPGEMHPLPVALRTGKEVRDVVHGIFHPEKGSFVWIKVTAVPLFRAGQNAPYQAYATIEDITISKNAESALLASERRFRELIKNSSDSITILDKDGLQIYVSAVVERMLGYAPAELMNIPVIDQMIHPEDRALVQETFLKILHEGEGRVQYRQRHKNGSWVYLEGWGTNQLANPDIRGVVVNVRDISFQKEAEEERAKLNDKLNQMQRLESIGLLAGGIAHDFNNLLGGMFGYVDMARLSLDENNPDEARENLENAFAVFDRTKALTRQLLTFAKGGAPVCKTISIVPLIRSSAQFALSGSNVTARFDIDENLWRCDCDENQIGQVIDNIVINAQQAMPVGGNITVSAKNVFIEKDGAGISSIPGNFIRISIQDNGIGISGEFIAKIFDPFFTTKAIGHGLGLATVYSIIKRHGGWIDVESQQGKGSTFHIFLPASQVDVPYEPGRTEEQHRGIGTVLVMDDEPFIRDTVRHMLKGMGYEVCEARDGAEAIALFRHAFEKKHGFVVTILDLTIPNGMGGKDAVKAIRQIDEKACVVVSSGYAEDPVMENPAKYGFTAKIAKPFTRNELSELLRRHIDKPV